MSQLAIVPHPVLKVREPSHLSVTSQGAGTQPGWGPGTEAPGPVLWSPPRHAPSVCTGRDKGLRRGRALSHTRGCGFSGHEREIRRGPSRHGMLSRRGMSVLPAWSRGRFSGTPASSAVPCPRENAPRGQEGCELGERQANPQTRGPRQLLTWALAARMSQLLTQWRAQWQGAALKADRAPAQGPSGRCSHVSSLDHPAPELADFRRSAKPRAQSV